MRYVIQFTCFALFVFMSCSDEGDAASTGNAESMATFSSLHDGFRKFAEIQKSAQFATLSPGFTFEKNCGSAYVESAAFIDPTHLDLATVGCFDLNFDGQPYFALYNFTSLDNGLTLSMELVFYGHPSNRNYDLNCLSSDCDDVSLLLRVVDPWGEEVVHYHGMPNVLSVSVSSNQVTASFDGLFYSDDFEEGGLVFNVAGTLVCCDGN